MSVLARGPVRRRGHRHRPETAGWPEPWTILRDRNGPVWPATPPLAHGLALARALRPLRLRRPSPGAWELDEEATAERAAAEDLWLPSAAPPMSVASI